MSKVGNNTHVVQAGECAWKYAKNSLQTKGQKVSNQQIVAEMQRLAKLNNCKSVEDFNEKFFSRAGNSFISDVQENKPATTADKPAKTPTPAKKSTTAPNGSTSKQDTTSVEKQVKTPAAKMDTLKQQAKILLKNDSTIAQSDHTKVARNDSLVQATAVDSTKTRQKLKTKTDSFQVEAAKINNIKDNKTRIIEYNKKHATGNYIIVDKKTCKATVYNKSGQALKSYEVLLGATKGDNLSTAFAKDNKLAASGRTTVPGDYTLKNRMNIHGGQRQTGDSMETMDPDIEYREWAPGYWGKKKFTSGSQAIHGTADRANRDKLYNNGNLADNRQSMGCINIPIEHLNEMESKYGIKANSKLYILPEEKGNELVLTKRKDGEVKFITKYKDPKQNAKIAKIQDKIANKNIQRKIEIQKNKAELAQKQKEKQKEYEFSLFKPSTWFG